MMVLKFNLNFIICGYLLISIGRLVWVPIIAQIAMATSSDRSEPVKQFMMSGDIGALAARQRS